MPLELKEAGDLADDDIVRREAQPGAELQVIGRVEEWFEREPAEDLRVLVRAPDACGQVLPLHGLSNYHKMSGAPGGVTLRGTKQRVGGPTLEGAERRAVNCVENDRNPGAGSSQPAQDARFAAVGVDQLRLPGAKQSRELLPGPCVFPGVERTHEFGHDGEQGRAASESGFQRALRASRRARNQINFQAGLLPETQDGGNGVLLGTPHNQTRDDMCDPHPGAVTGSRTSGL